MRLIYVITTIFVILLAFGFRYANLSLVSFLAFFALLLMANLLNQVLLDCFAKSSKFCSYLTERFFKKKDAIVTEYFGLFVLLFGFIGSSYFFYTLYEIAISSNLSFSCDLPLNKRILYLTVAIFSYFFSIFAVRVLQDNDEEEKCKKWFRLSSYLASFHSILFFIYVISFYIKGNQEYYAVLSVNYSIIFINIILLLLSLEILIAYFFRLTGFLKDSQYSEIKLPLIIEFIASKNSLKESILFFIKEKLGINFSESDMASYLAKVFEPAVIAALLFFWVSTSVIIVPVDRECIIRTMGTIRNNDSAGPGLHFKLPWPFATAEFYSPKIVNTMNIGFETDSEKTHLIWTKQHSLTNVNLIVGDGIELINIDCQIFWRINNLYNYLTSMENPNEFIEANAYKLLTLATVSSTFDEIISKDRTLLANKIRDDLQKTINEYSLGIEVVEAVFLAIHPPLEVAVAFEDVISAQIDKPTYVLKAQTEREHKLHFNLADAFAVELKAEMSEIDTVQRAAGDAYSIIGRSLPFNSEPELESFRLRLDGMQKLLGSKNIYILDKDLMRQNDGIFLNLSN